MKALVVFRGLKAEHPLGFLLKKGFRHCFVCLENDDLWIQIDYCAGIPEVKYLANNDFDLKGFYEDQGMTVVETYQRDTAPTVPVVIRNCVGLVKQVLGIRNFSFTPYSLYRRLNGTH